MRPKEYLGQLRHLDKEINTKLLLIEDLRARTFSIGSLDTKEKVQSSGGLNFSDWIDNVTDLEKEIKTEIEKLINLKNKINMQINKIDNPLYRLILINHYILNYTLQEIASKHNYSYSYIKHAHGEALESFKYYNQEEFKNAE